MAKSKSKFRGKQYRVESKIYNIGPRTLDDNEYRVRLICQRCNGTVDQWDSDVECNNGTMHLTLKTATKAVNDIKQAVVKGNAKEYFTSTTCLKCEGQIQ